LAAALTLAATLATAGRRGRRLLAFGRLGALLRRLGGLRWLGTLLRGILRRPGRRLFALGRLGLAVVFFAFVFTFVVVAVAVAFALAVVFVALALALFVAFAVLTALGRVAALLREQRRCAECGECEENQEFFHWVSSGAGVCRGSQASRRTPREFHGDFRKNICDCCRSGGLRPEISRRLQAQWHSRHANECRGPPARVDG